MREEPHTHLGGHYMTRGNKQFLTGGNVIGAVLQQIDDIAGDGLLEILCSVDRVEHESQECHSPHG